MDTLDQLIEEAIIERVACLSTIVKGKEPVRAAGYD